MVSKKTPLGRSRPSKGARPQPTPQKGRNIYNETCQRNLDGAAVMPPTRAARPTGEARAQSFSEEGDQLQSFTTESLLESTTPISARTPISGHNSSPYTYQVSDTSPATIPRSFINSPNPESWRGLQDTLRYPPRIDVLNDENYYVLQGVGGQGSLMPGSCRGRRRC